MIHLFYLLIPHHQINIINTNESVESLGFMPQALVFSFYRLQHFVLVYPVRTINPYVILHLHKVVMVLAFSLVVHLKSSP